MTLCRRRHSSRFDSHFECWLTRMTYGSCYAFDGGNSGSNQLLTFISTWLGIFCRKLRQNTAIMMCCSTGPSDSSLSYHFKQAEVPFPDLVKEMMCRGRSYFNYRSGRVEPEANLFAITPSAVTCRYGLFAVKSPVCGTIQHCNILSSKA